MAALGAVHAAKKVLRKEIKARLAAMTEEEKYRQSEILTQRLISNPKYQASKQVSLYLSFSNEVSTEGILRHIFQSGKRVFIPRYVGDKMDMLRLFSQEDYDSLPLTKWNIKQPPDDDNTRDDALFAACCNPLAWSLHGRESNRGEGDRIAYFFPPLGGLDLIIMPGLGFTPEGHRLGRGKGYYDSYLKKCAMLPSGQPYTIALAFREQMCDHIPVSEHDMTVDEVLFVEK
ncbi:5-formyltetrahydrofolate cyclo-ligase-like isoform X1 [Branchiostoma floridae x Branchiostoma japonicum]